MTADETINRWAAKKLEVPPETVERVEFVHEDGYWYSELTYEPHYDGAVVHMTDGAQRSIRLYVNDGEDFSALLREIIEAADS